MKEDSAVGGSEMSWSPSPALPGFTVPDTFPLMT